MEHLPDGFRFHPTDSELLKYLLVFLSNKPLPDMVPIEIEDLYANDPWVIFGDTTEKTLYFFTELKKKKIGNTRVVRSVGEGCWKSQDKGIAVSSPKGSLFGFKRSLRFQNSDSPQDGQWLMKEYTLSDAVKNYLRLRVQGYDKDNYVLCRIKRKAAKDDPIAPKETIDEEELDTIIHDDHKSSSINHQEIISLDTEDFIHGAVILQLPKELGPGGFSQVLESGTEDPFAPMDPIAQKETIDEEELDTIIHDDHKSPSIIISSESEDELPSIIISSDSEDFMHEAVSLQSSKELDPGGFSQLLDLDLCGPSAPMWCIR